MWHPKHTTCGCSARKLADVAHIYCINSSQSFTARFDRGTVNADAWRQRNSVVSEAYKLLNIYFLNQSAEDPRIPIIHEYGTRNPQTLLLLHLVLTNSRIPSTRLILSGVQRLHILFVKFKIVKILVLLDTSRCNRFRQYNKVLSMSH